VELSVVDGRGEVQDVFMDLTDAQWVILKPLLQPKFKQARGLNLAQAQANRYADTAALFQALGGGWWNRVDIPKI
jgi:hypothetical protein